MAVDCVEEPGEWKAEDGSQEKHPDHHLLLDRSHKRHVGSEHVHQAQTEEKQTACSEMRWQGKMDISDIKMKKYQDSQFLHYNDAEVHTLTRHKVAAERRTKLVYRGVEGRINKEF